MNDVTAWQRGELVFREMSIKEIITILERKYPYTFEYRLKNLKKINTVSVLKTGQHYRK